MSSIFVGVMSLLELRILEIHSFQHFSATCFDLLRWNLVYDFLFMIFRSSDCHCLRSSLKELYRYPLWMYSFGHVSQTPAFFVEERGIKMNEDADRSSFIFGSWNSNNLFLAFINSSGMNRASYINILIYNASSNNIHIHALYGHVGLIKCMYRYVL